MSLPRALRLTLKIARNISNSRYYSYQNPATKTWNIITQNLPEALGGNHNVTVYPEHADVVIIGGGFIGSAAAYATKTRAIHGLNIVVLDKDLTFKSLPNNLSLGVLCQHYSLPENIYLSQFSAEYLRNVKEHLGADVNIEYCPTGSLTLASEKYAHKLEENITTLREYGTRVQLLTADEVKENYPWINTSDVKFGCIGFESDGTFNPHELHKGYLKKNLELGINYVQAEVTGFVFDHQRDVFMEGIAPGSYQKMNQVIYTTPDGQEHKIKFAVCVLAAGHQSSDISKMANIGLGDGMLQVPLPVTKKEFNVYALDGKDAGLNVPMITDTTGLWLKKNNLENHLILGMTPTFMDGSKETDDNGFYDNVVLRSLENRLSNFNSINIKCVGKEFQDCSTYDNTGILGPHPYYSNLVIAAGFGRQGCHHAPGIGRAIAELIIDSRFTTIDLTRFGYDRLLTAEPLVEFNIY